jgi:peptidyl-tRNA hydrolase, PTH1 family
MKGGSSRKFALWIDISLYRLKEISSHFRKNLPGEITAPHLIVGLGNPGRQYRHNRHNIGFLVLDQLSERLGVNFSRLQSRALITKTIYQEAHIVLAKPQTFMNHSGQAVAGLIKFYKIPPVQLLVAYDDVDLPFGSIRIRPDGGSAGHKGMNSIIDQLGTQDFPRLRIGIGRPPGRMDAAGYVLQDFSKDEREMLRLPLDRAGEAILTFITSGLEAAMNRFNSLETL